MQIDGFNAILKTAAKSLIAFMTHNAFIVFIFSSFITYELYNQAEQNQR